MAKGDDAVARKRNKNSCKNQQRDTLKVSKRVASLIAAKKRRKSGKRRKCQGMCFSLPSPEDPFNERLIKNDSKPSQVKKSEIPKEDCDLSTKRKGSPPRKGHTNSSRSELADAKIHTRLSTNLVNEQRAVVKSIGNGGQKTIWKFGKEKIQKLGISGAAHIFHAHATLDYPGCPSKFLTLSLNSIQKALRHDDSLSSEEDKPFFVDPWGVEFWNCYSLGKDMLVTSEHCSNTVQIAWMASTAADTISRKEKENLSFTTPFLLFLVPSQEKATKVRSVCKPLKALGIHTVSLHLGASLEHQIYGLKNCEPEFVVSTPERLLELISLKAIDISGVSLMVVDGLGTFTKEGHLYMLTSIRQSISASPQMVVFNDFSSYEALPTAKCLLQGSICRVSSNSCIASQSSCIIQSVHMCTSEEDKLLMAIKVLAQLCSAQPVQMHSNVLFVVGNRKDAKKLTATIKSKGYLVSTSLINDNPTTERKTGVISITEAEQISNEDLHCFETIVIYDFVTKIENYVKILTNMARFTVGGVLRSFLTGEEAHVAAPLVEILELCGQTVPGFLRDLSQCSSKLED